MSRAEKRGLILLNCKSNYIKRSTMLNALFYTVHIFFCSYTHILFKKAVTV